MENVNILVIGGAGYIGSHTVKMLKESNYNVIIYDDLSKGHEEVASILDVKFIKGDLGDKQKLKEVFDEYKIDIVYHFAAFIEVGESVQEPSKYYNNNVVKVLNLLDQMLESGVNNFVFSSTAATFGTPIENKINETHPQNPINPYGESKLMMEKILKDYKKAYGLNSVILRYFNASGADESGLIGESHTPETHLIPLILKAAKGERDKVKVYGTTYDTKDGTCIRDYVHVNDLSLAHILGMKKMIETNESYEYNLGSGEGYSVKEVIDKVKAITGKDFEVLNEDRREGDPAVLVGDASKIRKELNWKPKYNLDKIIETAWNWEINKKF